MSRGFPLVAIAVVITLALLAGACTGDDGEGAASTTTTTSTERGNVDETLAIGQLASVTGDLALLSPSFTKPVELAVAEMNVAGGVNGAPVTLSVADDASTQTTADASLAKLVDTDKVDVVIGPSSSNVALAQLEQVAQARVLECAGSNTALALSLADSDGYYFRTTPSDRLQSRALAQLLTQDGRKQPGFLVRDDAYGLGLARATARALRRGGATPKPIVAYDPAGAGLAADAARVAESGPDAVVVIGFPEDGAKALAALNSVGINPTTLPTYGTDAMESTRLAGLVDPANPAIIAGMKGTTPAAVPAGVGSPFDAVIATSGVNNVFSSYYYDCAILSALAAVKAGTDDPVALKRAFSKNLEGKTECNTFAACKAALEAGRSIHYRGASSRFDDWAGFEPGHGAYDVWSYDTTGKPVTAPRLQIAV